jgi:hypothetical protein
MVSKIRQTQNRAEPFGRVFAWFYQRFGFPILDSVTPHPGQVRKVNLGQASGLLFLAQIGGSNPLNCEWRNFASRSGP